MGLFILALCSLVKRKGLHTGSNLQLSARNIIIYSRYNIFNTTKMCSSVTPYSTFCFSI